MRLKPEDLDKIAEKQKAAKNLRDGAGRARVVVHMGTCGIASGARAILSGFLNLIEANNATDVMLTTSGCAGLCSREPMVTVELQGQAPVKYVDLTEEKVKTIFTEHIGNGKVVADYALAVGSERVS